MTSVTQKKFSYALDKALADECRDILHFFRSRILETSCDPIQSPNGWRKGSFSWEYVQDVLFYTDRMFYFIGEMVMPRGRNTSTQSRSLADYTFVRCELNTETKKAAKAWIEKSEQAMGTKIHDLVASDYKLSVSFSSEHDTFTASATGKEGAVNQFKTLTARHKDWYVAVQTLVFKHEVMFKGGVWESDESDEDGWA